MKEYLWKSFQIQIKQENDSPRVSSVVFNAYSIPSSFTLLGTVLQMPRYIYKQSLNSYIAIRLVLKSIGDISRWALANYWSNMSKLLACCLILLCLGFQYVYCQLSTGQGNVGHVSGKRIFNSGSTYKVLLVITWKHFSGFICVINVNLVIILVFLVICL